MGQNKPEPDFLSQAREQLAKARSLRETRKPIEKEVICDILYALLRANAKGPENSGVLILSIIGTSLNELLQFTEAPQPKKRTRRRKLARQKVLKPSLRKKKRRRRTSPLEK